MKTTTISINSIIPFLGPLIEFAIIIQIESILLNHVIAFSILPIN